MKFLSVLLFVAATTAAGLPRAAGSQCVAGNKVIEGRQCRVECATVQPSGDYKIVALADSASCAAACAADSKCVTALYDNSNGYCYFKGTVDQAAAKTVDRVVCDGTSASTTTTATSSISTTAPSCFSDSQAVISGRTCTVECGYDRPGGEYTSKRTGSFSACISACASDSKCVGAQYLTTNGYCYLKSSNKAKRLLSTVNGVVCGPAVSSAVVITSTTTTTTTSTTPTTSTTIATPTTTTITTTTTSSSSTTPSTTTTTTVPSTTTTTTTSTTATTTDSTTTTTTITTDSSTTTTTTATTTTTTTSTSTSPYCSKYTQYSKNGNCGVQNLVVGAFPRNLIAVDSIEQCFYQVSLSVPSGKGSVYYDDHFSFGGGTPQKMCGWFEQDVATVSTGPATYDGATLCLFDQACVPNVVPTTACLTKYGSISAPGKQCALSARIPFVGQREGTDKTTVSSLQDCFKRALLFDGVNPNVGSVSYQDGFCTVFNQSVPETGAKFTIASPQCFFDLACAGSSSGTGSASPPKPSTPAANGLLGDGAGSCFGNGDCASNFCNSQHYCGYIANGQKCYGNNECQSNLCTDYGSFGGTCKAPTTPGYWGDTCRTNTDCVTNNCYQSRCALTPDGENHYCTNHGDCFTTAYCKTDANVCVPRRIDGDDYTYNGCRFDDMCAGGFCTSVGLCGKRAPGQSCGGDNDCGTGYCYDCYKETPNAPCYKLPVGQNRICKTR